MSQVSKIEEIQGGRGGGYLPHLEADAKLPKGKAHVRVIALSYPIPLVKEGLAPGEAAQDAEGLQTMRTLGRNMAWMLKSLKNGGQPMPEREQGIATNFIR